MPFCLPWWVPRCGTDPYGSLLSLYVQYTPGRLHSYVLSLLPPLYWPHLAVLSPWLQQLRSRGPPRSSWTLVLSRRRQQQQQQQRLHLKVRCPCSDHHHPLPLLHCHCHCHCRYRYRCRSQFSCVQFSLQRDLVVSGTLVRRKPFGKCIQTDLAASGCECSQFGLRWRTLQPQGQPPLVLPCGM